MELTYSEIKCKKLREYANGLKITIFCAESKKNMQNVEQKNWKRIVWFTIGMKCSYSIVTGIRNKTKTEG